jgi:hypothetical protein
VPLFLKRARDRTPGEQHGVPHGREQVADPDDRAEHLSGPVRGVQIVDRFSMARSYGRDGRLATKPALFGPGVRDTDMPRAGSVV